MRRDGKEGFSISFFTSSNAHHSSSFFLSNFHTLQAQHIIFCRFKVRSPILADASVMIARITQLRSDHPIAVRRRRRVIQHTTMSASIVVKSVTLEITTGGVQEKAASSLLSSANVKSNYANHFLAPTPKKGSHLLESLVMLMCSMARFAFTIFGQEYPWSRTFELGLMVIIIIGICLEFSRQTSEQRKQTALYMAVGGLVEMVLGCAVKTEHGELLSRSLPSGLITGHTIMGMVESLGRKSV